MLYAIGLFRKLPGTHLKSHGFTVEEYKNKYPNNKTISSEVIADISQKNSGKIRTEEHKKNLSNSLKGKTAWNKGISGVYTATEETKEKMRISQTGRVHSEETKEKMSKSQLGIKKSPQAIENNRKAQLEYYKNNKGIWNGKKRSPQDRKIISEAMKKYQESLTPERKAELAEARAKKTRGKIRTEEQKLRYQEARSKYMSDNPIKVVKTKGERTIEARLAEKGMRFQRQFRITGNHHPYDFYLSDYNLIIEFDGSHHWLGPWWGTKNKTEQQLKIMLEKQQAKDAYNNLHAGRAGYRIIRLYGRGDVGCKEWGTFDEQLLVQGFPELI